MAFRIYRLICSSVINDASCEALEHFCEFSSFGISDFRKDLRSGRICVEPDEHWHCFKANVGNTAERWCMHMGLSMCCSAILSRNGNLAKRWS